MEKIYGIIYPIPIQFINRIFVDHRNVYVKYVGRPAHIRLTPKNKILFYASQGTKEIVGEGTIQSIEYMSPNEAFSKHGSNLFLSEEELKSYVKQNPNRNELSKLLVFTLSNIKRYSKTIKNDKPITMTGEYLNQEKYSRLMKQIS
jgi:hypothetical protein